MPDSPSPNWRRETRRFEPGGSAARQLLDFCNSPDAIGMTATGGRVVLRLSPQVKSIPMSTEKKKKESEAVPWACHGVGPSSVRSTSIPLTPSANTFTEKEVETSTVK